ncbi:MAG: hypothetical protein ACRD3G_09580 [Vicinamibacterales bacterium]
MRRAIVNFFWGPKYLREALASISRSVPVGVPRIAITDEATARLIRGSPFERVIVAAIRNRSLLGKAELITNLPAEFDSFLFLDTDAVVVGDISHAFARAETFGIAAAMAPHYSLDAFWDFHRVLNALGVPCVNQLQYNTGVLFFVRRPDVDAVFHKWHELTTLHIEGVAYDNDQPFFTLALELLGFNPYTLSPSYNYRALGELASGTIRIWHSHAPVPADINSFSDTWPPRRYYAGERLPFR